MLNSESCELGAHGLDLLLSGRVERLARRRPRTGGTRREHLRAVSRDFASVLYSELVRQMQRTVTAGDEDSDGPVSQGARDLLRMFLPRALAAQRSDPVSRQIYRNLSTRYGESSDESR